jgi:fatty-acyl-CoA synthase
LAIDVLGVHEVCNAYGMTEGYGHSTSHLDPREIRINSQGRVLPTQELRIVGPDGGVLPKGQVGEIQIRKTVTPGYLDAPDLNAAAFDEQRWFRTRDIGMLDTDGRLHYVGRGTEMVKVKGISVSPAEVARVLVEPKLVDEAYVFGVSPPEGDQVVGCALVCSAPNGARARLAEDVTAWARGQMASYKVPSLLWVVTSDELPQTTTGKVSKRLLKEKLIGIAE